MGTQHSQEATSHGTLRIKPELPFPYDLPELFGPDKNGFYYHQKDLAKIHDSAQTIHIMFKYNAIDYDPHRSYQEKQSLKSKNNRYKWIYVVNHAKCYEIQQSSYYDAEHQQQRTMVKEYEKIRTSLLQNDPVPPYFLRHSKLADDAYESIFCSRLCNVKQLKCRIATGKKKQNIKRTHPALLIWDRREHFLQYNDQPVFLIHWVARDDKIQLECRHINKYELNRNFDYYNYKEHDLQVNHGLSDIVHWCLKYDMDNNYQTYVNMKKDCSHFMIHLFEDFQIVNPWYTLSLSSVVKPEKETLISVLKSNNLYNDLYQVLNQASIDLETLQCDVKINEIQEFGTAVGMDETQLQQFEKLMTIIHSSSDDEKSICEHSSKIRHDYDMTMVVVLIGDSGVGKTSLARRYVSGKYTANICSTIGVGNYYCNEPLSDDTVMRMEIWDTAGQERFRSLTRGYYRKADTFIVCFDVNQENTFENCSEWIQCIHDYGKDKVPVILVGCKGDVSKSDRQSAEDQAQRIMDRFETLYCECSSKTGDNVRNVFHTAAELVLQTRVENKYTYSQDILLVMHDVDTTKHRGACDGGGCDVPVDHR
eukprot:17249_1